MSKQQILFIINPISGKGKKINWKEIIEKNIDQTRYSYSIQFTSRKKDATLLSKKAVENKVDIVCAVGGDGTINEVAKGLLHTNTALAIIPRGSGNGLARHFNIPLHPERAIQNINDAQIMHMDVGQLNGELFLCVAGIGFDAYVAHAFDSYGKRGFLSYIWLSIKSYFNFRPITSKIKIGDRTLDIKSFLIAFANASQFGNDTYIAPQASTNDGLLNLVVIKPFPFWQIPILMIKTFTKRIHTSIYHQSFEFDKLYIETPNSLTHLDGEPILTPSTLTIKVVPKALYVLN